MKIDINKIFELKAFILNKQIELVKDQPEELRGKARESLIQDFLKPFLPQNLGIDGGVIFSSDGETSGEIDIIIYDKNAYELFKPFSNFMPQKSKPFPIECVYCIIEVESDLTEKTLEKIVQKVQKVKKLQKKEFYPQSGLIHKIKLYEEEFEYFPVLGYLFSLHSSNLEDIHKKLISINKDLNISIKEQIDSITVLNKGLIVPYNNSLNKLESIQNKDTQMKIVSESPEQHLRYFYLGLMNILSHCWTGPINILNYFQREDKNEN